MPPYMEDSKKGPARRETYILLSNVDIPSKAEDGSLIYERKLKLFSEGTDARIYFSNHGIPRPDNLVFESLHEAHNNTFLQLENVGRDVPFYLLSAEHGGVYVDSQLRLPETHGEFRGYYLIGSTETLTLQDPFPFMEASFHNVHLRISTLYDVCMSDVTDPTSSLENERELEQIPAVLPIAETTTEISGLEDIARLPQTESLYKPRVQVSGEEKSTYDLTHSESDTSEYEPVGSSHVAGVKRKAECHPSYSCLSVPEPVEKDAVKRPRREESPELDASAEEALDSDFGESRTASPEYNDHHEEDPMDDESSIQESLTSEESGEVIRECNLCKLGVDDMENIVSDDRISMSESVSDTDEDDKTANDETSIQVEHRTRSSQLQIIVDEMKTAEANQLHWSKQPDVLDAELKEHVKRLDNEYKRETKEPAEKLNEACTQINQLLLQAQDIYDDEGDIRSLLSGPWARELQNIMDKLKKAKESRLQWSFVMELNAIKFDKKKEELQEGYRVDREERGWKKQEADDCVAALLVRARKVIEDLSVF